jgi:hypothetical protein
MTTRASQSSHAGDGLPAPPRTRGARIWYTGSTRLSGDESRLRLWHVGRNPDTTASEVDRVHEVRRAAGATSSQSGRPMWRCRDEGMCVVHLRASVRDCALQGPVLCDRWGNVCERDTNRATAINEKVRGISRRLHKRCTKRAIWRRRPARTLGRQASEPGTVEADEAGARDWRVALRLAHFAGSLRTFSLKSGLVMSEPSVRRR